MTRVSLIVTTNLPFEQWMEVLGSERLNGSMLDRLTRRVHIIEAIAPLASPAFKRLIPAESARQSGARRNGSGLS